MYFELELGTGMAIGPECVDPVAVDCEIVDAEAGAFGA